MAKKSMEKSLWKSANKLRGKVESSEYKHVVLGLIFLKFASDKFEHKQKEMKKNGQAKYLDNVAFYTKDNIFYLSEKSRWSFLMKNAKQEDLALKIDTALSIVEKKNPVLKGALPDNYYSRLNLDVKKLSSLLDTINNIHTTEDNEEDIVGRIYEYFLGQFASKEGKKGGEFYTPKCIVKLIAEMIEPFKGKVYDPCCGSGGMFVQSIDFVKNHHGNKKNISIYGQEHTATTYKLAKMNLAIRGISANFGEKPADTFFDDQHKELKADFIMANPPFNQSEWRQDNQLTNDPRWNGYEVPPTGNANYAWILHMVSKLSKNGIAGFVLANGSLSTNTSGEGEIRKKLIDNKLVDCIVAMPPKLFYTTGIPVCIWILNKNKTNQDEILFLDARKKGKMLSRRLRELTSKDINDIAKTYHNWKNNKKKYEDIKGFCKSAKLKEIEKHDFILTPGRYVGIEEEEDDGIPFEDKMETLTNELANQFEKSSELEKKIRENLENIGFDLKLTK